MLPARIWGLAAAVVCCLSPTLRAEVFHLINGGEVRGEVVNPDQSPRSHWVIKTSQGGQISLPAEQVKKVDKQSAAEIEYDRLAAAAPDTVQGQWDLAEFCRQHRLTAQRTAHLGRIVEIDPDHAAARGALGYSRVGGEWITVEEGMDAQGRKRYKNAWRYPQEIELMERARKDELGTKEWNNKLKRWRVAFTAGKAEAVSLQMAEIRDPLAVKALTAFLKDDNNREFRLQCADALARIGGMALDGLIVASLTDRDEEVRAHCLEQLHTAHYKPAVVRYIHALKDKDNETVNLAAAGLFYMNDASAIPALIDALVTSHKQVIHPGSQAGQMSSTFSSGPGGTGGGNFSFGQQQPQVIKREYQNPEVLRALAMLSGVNFEYDVQAWKNWYTSRRKSTTFDTRRDDL